MPSNYQVANSYNDWLQEVYAVIVLYNLELIESPTFNSLLKSNNSTSAPLDILVYDNSPSAQELGKCERLNLEYVHHPSNTGVSVAYNVAFEKARLKRKKLLLLLDQDTDFPGSFLFQYYQSLKEFPAENILAPILKANKIIISPFKPWLGGGKPIRKPKAGKHNLADESLVNSGLLISTEAFEKSGGYDERFPLDFSDYSFCERLRKKCQSFVVVPAIGQHDHSSFTLSFKEELHRFNQYCQSAIHFKEYYNKNTLVKVRLITRAIRLTVKYKSLQFLAAMVNHVFR